MSAQREKALGVVGRASLPKQKASPLGKLAARAALLPAVMLFAAGLALCLFFGQYLPMPIANLVMWTCLATLAFCIILYNRYTLLGFAAAAGIAAFILWRSLTPAQMRALWELLSENAGYVSGFLFGQTPYDSAYDPALFSAIIAACSLAAALLAFRLRTALGMALMALGVSMLEWSLSGAVILPALWPAAVGCALVFSMRGFRKAPSAPLSAMALAMAFVLMASGLTALIVPEDTSRLRTPFVEKMLDNVNDLFSDYTGFQRPHSSFSIASMGFQPLGDRLGGAVSLPDHEVLAVSSVTPGLLRGNVRNYYTGSSWARSASIRTYRLDNPLIADRQDGIMGVALPPQGKETDELFSREFALRVTHLSNMNSTLFTVGRVRGIDPASADIITNFDENSEAFSKRIVPMNASYLVNARVPMTYSASFPVAMNQLYQMDLLPETDAETAERNAFLYLGLPEEFPQSVGELTKEIIQGAQAQNDYEKALAIRDYLLNTRRFTYTLTPQDPPADRDFVEYFLETREGYCTYYASAMAVMARTAGLPSRYVEGFLLAGSTRSTEIGYTVKANQAHAWAEVYISGAGWLPFDATPMARAEAQAQSDYAYMPEPTPPSELDTQDDSPLDFVGGAMFSIPWWAYAAAGLIVLIATFFFVLGAHERRWATDRLEVRHPGRSEQLAVIWRDILRELSMLGVPMRIGETPYSYAARIDSAVENPEGSLGLVAEYWVRVRYGGMEPSRNDIDHANAYRGELDVQIKKAVGRMRYLFLRALRRMPKA